MEVKAAWRRIAAFAALAVLAGPVTSWVMSGTGAGAQWLGRGETAVGLAVTGCALLAVGMARKQRLPDRNGMVALLVLLAPQWLTGLLSPSSILKVRWLHPTPWAVAFFVSLAAPLWLGLLCSLQLISDEVPRATAAASIAGIGAVCLMIPTESYAIAPMQIPAAALQVLLGIATVFSWAYARPRLASAGTAAAAGYYLLGSALVLLTYGSGAGMPLDWRAAAMPLLLKALLDAAQWWLWFWLLERLSLAAFGMRTLALWVAATLLPGGLLLWFLPLRADAALAIAITALVIALRATGREEQPATLGLGAS